MTDTIYVTGAKGGSGATTCAVMLGSALSEEGERTLYVDGDTDCANGLELCGLQGLSVYTLADVEQGACRVKQAIIQHPDFPNMYVLPSLDCKNEDVINRAVAECEQPFDFLVCDNAAKSVCRRAVLVCEHYHPSVTYKHLRAKETRHDVV